MLMRQNVNNDVTKDSPIEDIKLTLNLLVRKLADSRYHLPFLTQKIASAEIIELFY